MANTKSYPCATCPLRAKFEKSPRSLVGRFWRWHINFCPGWRGYFNSLDEAQKQALRERYQFTKL